MGYIAVETKQTKKNTNKQKKNNNKKQQKKNNNKKRSNPLVETTFILEIHAVTDIKILINHSSRRKTNKIRSDRL